MASLKVGAFYQGRDRSFDARRFNLEPASSRFSNPACSPDPTMQPLDRAFSDPYVQNCYQLRENTQGTDSYTAESSITAAYGMVELAGFDEKVRLVGGPRFEHWKQTLTTAGRTYNFDTPDILPGGSLIFRATEEMNVRLAASQTVARPQLRELAPFLFSDYFGARDNQGNPSLQRTLVTNLDARWEWFPAAGEVLAASVFYKYFKKPIEPIIYQQGSSTLNYFSNAPNAQNLGLELEARKSLAFLGKDVPVIQDLSAVANVTLVRSRVEIPGDPTIRSVLTTQDSRALTFQAPYIVNTALDWAPKGGKARLRAMYNVFGPRLVLVGIQGVPDLFEMPRHVVDVTGAYKFDSGFEVRVTAENLLNAPWRFQHGVENEDALAQRYLTGTNLNVFLTYVND
jgi:outer membrane receptor protein involved in Fe transport